jgi:hypothetical protein
LARIDAAASASPPVVQPPQLNPMIAGVRYVYNGSRYDQLADAIAYASLMLSRPQFEKATRVSEVVA